MSILIFKTIKLIIKNKLKFIALLKNRDELIRKF
jgi:hypothetical protein